MPNSSYIEQSDRLPSSSSGSSIIREPENPYPMARLNSIQRRIIRNDITFGTFRSYTPDPYNEKNKQINDVKKEKLSSSMVILIKI